MDALFALRRKTSVLIKSRPGTDLHLLHNCLIFAFHQIDVCSRTGAQFSFIPDVCAKTHFAKIGLQWPDNIHRQTPGVKIEHKVGKQPIIIGRHHLSVILVPWRQIKYLHPAFGDTYLAIAPTIQFGAVGIPVEQIGQSLVYEWNMKTFEVVIAVQSPVGPHQVIAGTGGAEPECFDGQKTDFSLYAFYPGVKRKSRIERREYKLPPLAHRECREVVGRAREVFHTLGFGHRHKGPVHLEAPAVVSAHDPALEPTGVFHQDFTPVGTHVGQTMQRIGAIAQEQQRLFHKVIHKRKRHRVMGQPNRFIGVGNQLPGTGKYMLFAGFKSFGGIVKCSGKGGCATDIGLDLVHYAVNLIVKAFPAKIVNRQVFVPWHAMDYVNKIFVALTIAMLLAACSRPKFTANDIVPPFPDRFDYGSNIGIFEPYYHDMDLAVLAHGSPDGSIPGVGITAIRPGLFDYFLDRWGFDSRKEHFQYYKHIGLRNTVAIIGFPAERHRDTTCYCAGTRSELFKNLYEPIWDKGENGTPVNDNNAYALYVWKAATAYKGLIRIWEVWNEPDFGNENAWKTPGMPGNWWENAPAACDTKLKAPVFHYIRTLRISYEVIKSIDPSAFVAVGGLGWPGYLDAICRFTDEPSAGAETKEYPFKGGAWFDCMSFHSYPHLDHSMRAWDNHLGGFQYFRHSDAGVDGLWRLRDRFASVLQQYGYNDTIYPDKLWICTEYNIPRRAFGDYIGSDTAQLNFVIKALVTAQLKGMAQMHLYSLADEKKEKEATNEFSFMGLFQNLHDVKPPDAIPNDVAFAVKTTQALLGKSRFSRVETQRLQLPENICGAAFCDDLGRYTYVLWARTLLDKDETVRALYNFPENLHLNVLDQKNWDFSRTGVHTRISALQIELSGSPVFLSPF